VNSLPIFEGDGPTPAQTLTTFVDITQLKRQETALIEAVAAAERASAAKSTFLANVSHEIRTPLNGVIALAKALSRLDMPDRQREMVGIIVNSGESLERILNDLLDIAKIEASRMELEIAPFDLAAEIQTCTDLMRLRADGKGIAFEVAFSSEAKGFFLGDALRLRQVVANLTANAIKFTDSGGVSLTVEVEPLAADDCRLTITVNDTGIGLDADVLPLLFERFVQGDDTFTRRFGGTGLGLAICKNLVTLMGGKIEARALPERGSSFAFSVPLRRAEAPAAAASESSAPAVRTDRRLRVLLAEDHPVNQRVVQLILAPHGADVVVVENGALALEAFKSGQFDLVLMDLQMPVMDGLTATRAIRAHEEAGDFARTPIVALSASAMASHQREALQAGADLHLSKPITALGLVAGIHQALGARPA
ncbi:MAG: hypothetical protein B7Y78_04360, partial [Caulobacter sp. 35-67-4]